MKSYFEKLIAKKEARANELKEQIKNCENLDEVRGMYTELQNVGDELAEARNELAKLNGQGEGMNVVATMQQRKAEPNKAVDPYDTEEYRKAFMEFCTRGTPLPAEFRANAVTATGDVGAVIPTTILNEIISEFESYGNIYRDVRKLNIKGGVSVPILSLKPVATWITADTGASESDTQKVVVNTSISFNYYGLECKIAQTLLASVTTIDAFQRLFIPLAADAMAKALDIAIMNGSGNGQPLGITKDTRVPTANVVTIAPADFKSWEGWKKKIFAKMKKSYREGKFYMAQATFDGYIDGMVDSVGQPIGRVNYGIDGGERYRFGGKDVETVEDAVITSYDDAKTGDVVAVFADLKDYAINSNLEMQVVQWVDHDANAIKYKVIMICDGKLIDPNGVIIVKKGAAG